MGDSAECVVFFGGAGAVRGDKSHSGEKIFTHRKTGGILKINNLVRWELGASRTWKE